MSYEPEFDSQTWPVAGAYVLPAHADMPGAVYLAVVGGPKAYLRLTFKDGHPVSESGWDWRHYLPDAALDLS